jgi:hypothetical protein
MVIALLDKPNAIPTARGDTVATERNVSISCDFRVTDDDMSNLKIKIVSEPEKGEVDVHGISFTYTPFLNMTGSDSFTWCAVDEYGAGSPTVTESITIEKPQGKIVYADMNGSTYNYAAPIFNRVIDAYMTGDIENARVEQSNSLAFVALMSKYGAIPAQKAVMKMIGFDCGPARLPLQNLTKQQYCSLQMELDSIGFFERIDL